MSSCMIVEADLWFMLPWVVILDIERFLTVNMYSTVTWSS